MTFYSEGISRWDKIEQAGSGATALTATTPRWRLVTTTKAPADRYAKGELTNATTDVIAGVTDGADDFASTDPYTLKDSKLARIKTSCLLWVETATAYVGANKDKGIEPDATAGNEGMATVAASGGTGRIVDGKTVGGKHYLAFWKDESEK